MSLRKLRRVALWLVGVVALLWTGTFAAVVLWSRRDQARSADAIVVLGAAQYVGHPSPVLKARLDHAIDLWRQHLAHVVILTGGVGTGDTTSEAEVERRYMIAHGIPDGAILLETEGRTTRESMASVARIMRARKMSTAVLVSDRFHMLRLRILASQFGIAAVTSPTPWSPIRMRGETYWRYAFAESLKVPLTLLLEWGD